MKRPIVLTILDGYGLNPSDYGNAVTAAASPNLDRIFSECPTTQIGAAGLDVGLPDGQMGNSEVGHTNMGAGRVVYQELTRISKAIKDGDFYHNPVLTGTVSYCLQNNTALHLMGLLSDGGVHSHNTHLYAILKLAKNMGLSRVYVHCILDGRDVPPTSGKDFVAELQMEMDAIGVGKISTVTGRYYAMDRDNRWERVQRAYAAFVYGEGEKSGDPVAAVAASYENKVTDEFMLPTVIDGGKRVAKNDCVIFYNFRPDRAREITRTFVDPDFDGFSRREFFPLKYICMTQYDALMPNVQIAFTPQSLKNTLGEYLSDNGLSQLRIAETEKYAHVTFFFNGGVEKIYDGEDRVLIPSPKVATYDLQPEMSACEVCDSVISRIESGKYDVIILNFANCDMVGHTGIMDAAIAAVSTVDTCVGKISAAVDKAGGVLLITADHGNADQMYEPDGSPFTAHTTWPVPFAVEGFPCTLRSGGRLCDISPTILRILGLPQPPEMDGISIIE